MNYELTLGENLADLGGMSLSLKAMIKQIDDDVKEKITECKKLMTRVFFKSFANIWKQNIRKESQINRLTTDPHAPTEFRANMVKNIDEFHQVFGTKKGDVMWLDPNDRVNMW